MSALSKYLAASEMEAALARLNIQPGHSTEAELRQDDAEILPGLVDGQPVITPEPNSGMSEGREISAQNHPTL